VAGIRRNGGRHASESVAGVDRSLMGQQHSARKRRHLRDSGARKRGPRRQTAVRGSSQLQL